MADNKVSKDFMLRTICNVFARIKPKWFEIGIQIGISRNKLEEFQEVKDPLSAVVDYWLSGNVNKAPITWEFIITVLKSEHVGEPGLAEMVRRQYFDSEVEDGQGKFTRIPTPEPPMLSADLKSASEMEPSPKRLKLHQPSTLKFFEDQESAVVRSIRDGDWSSFVKLAGQQKKSLNNIVNDKNETILHIACYCGRFDMAQFLVEIYHCNSERKDTKGNSPLSLICIHQKKKYDWMCYSSQFSALLEEACQKDSIDMLRFLLCCEMSKELYVKSEIYEDANTLHYLSYAVPYSEFLGLVKRALLQACNHNCVPIIEYLFSFESIYVDLLETVPSLLTIASEHQHFPIIDYLTGLSSSKVRLDCQWDNKDFRTAFTKKHCVDKVSMSLESALFYAVRCGDQHLLNYLSQRCNESLVTDVNSNGDTLLHVACISGDLKLVERVYELDKKCVDKANNIGNTCLHIASKWGLVGTIKFLIKVGFQINVKNNNGELPLHLAIINEQSDVVNFFLSEHADSLDINSATIYGETPLHLVTLSSRYLKLADEVLAHSKCMSISSCDVFGNTPLFNAISIGSIEMVKLLIRYNNDANYLFICNKLKETVFHIACRLKKKDILDFLFKTIQQQSVFYPSKVKNSLGQTLLHVACHMGDMEFLKYLTKQNSYVLKDDINVLEDSINLTPLQYACIMNKKQLFECLISCVGCDPNSINRDGNSALHICCKYNLKDMALLCFKHCSFTDVNKEGDTPLHLACTNRNFKLALEMMRHCSFTGKLDSCKNSSGYSALHVAAQQEGALDVIKYMITNQLFSPEDKSKQHGETALHLACLKGNIENSVYLFSLKYDERSKFNKCDQSPLHLALLARNYSFLQAVVTIVPDWQLKCCAKLCFDFHSEVSVVPLLQCLIATLRDNHRIDSDTDIYSCTKSEECLQFSETFNYILDRIPATALMVDSHGCSLLHYLSFFGCTYMEKAFDKVVQLCDIALSDKLKRTALHVACLCKNQFFIYKLLQLESGYQLLEMQDRRNQTPSDLYQLPPNSYYHSNHEGVLSYLAAHGANLATLTDTEYSKVIQSVNVVMVGNFCVGKSTLIQRLVTALTHDLKKPEPITERTTGMVTTLVTSSNNHSYNFFEFAGHAQFEFSHSKGLHSILSLAAETPSSSPFVFLLLVNGSETFDKNKEQIDKWFSFLKSHLNRKNKINLAIVCSHDDWFQDEDRNKRKGDLKEYVFQLQRDIPSIFNIKLNEEPIFINCLETETAALNFLLRYLNNVNFSCQLFNPTTSYCQLRKYLQENRIRMPCQIKDLVESLNQITSFQFCGTIVVHRAYRFPQYCSQIPRRKKKLLELLKLLHDQHNIVLLVSPMSDELSWWIISKEYENVLLSKVQTIFAPEDFKNAPNFSSSHNTGVVPFKEISELFKDLHLSIDFIENYLLTMGYCKVIEDEEVLKLIVGSNQADESKHFFFPGLIKNEKAAALPRPASNSKNFGWLLKSEEKLGISFLHSLLLRLIFKFSRDSDASKYSKRLSLWKCGLCWCTYSGIQVLVEVLQDRKIILILRCTSSKLVLLAKLRSEVIAEICDVLSGSVNADMKADVSEHYLYPPPTDFDNYENFLLSNDVRHPSVELKKAFHKEPSSRSIDLTENSVASLSDILGFDSYVPLEKSILSLLQGSDETTDTLKQCFDCFQSEFESSELKQVLDITSSGNLYESWMQKHPSEPLQKLREQLDKYSAFKLSDLHIV